MSDGVGGTDGCIVEDGAGSGTNGTDGCIVSDGVGGTNGGIVADGVGSGLDGSSHPDGVGFSDDSTVAESPVVADSSSFASPGPTATGATGSFPAIGQKETGTEFGVGFGLIEGIPNRKPATAWRENMLLAEA